jgi:hypothetical protein
MHCNDMIDKGIIFIISSNAKEIFITQCMFINKNNMPLKNQNYYLYGYIWLSLF